MNTPPAIVQQALRDALVTAVLFRVDQDLADSIPADIAPDTRKAILAEVIPNARFTLSRLTTDELQNDKCIEHEIQTALRVAHGFVERIRAQRRRSQ